VLDIARQALPAGPSRGLPAEIEKFKASLQMFK
jgi:hypothetical protein